MHIRIPVIGQGLLLVEVLKLETGEKVEVVFFDILHDFLDDFLPVFPEVMSFVFVHPTKNYYFIPLLDICSKNTSAPFSYIQFIDKDNSIVRSFISVFGEVGQVQFFSANLFVHLKHVLGLALEVGSGVEAVGNEDSVIKVTFLCLISFRNFGEFILNFSNDVEGNFDFFLGLVGLNSGADDSNVSILLTNAMDERDHHDVDV